MEYSKCAHKQKIRYVCYNDRYFLCQECVQKDHSKHSTYLLKDAIAFDKDQITRDMEEVKEITDNIEYLREELEVRIEDEVEKLMAAVKKKLKKDLLAMKADIMRAFMPLSRCPELYKGFNLDRLQNEIRKIAATYKTVSVSTNEVSKSNKKAEEVTAAKQKVNELLEVLQTELQKLNLTQEGMSKNIKAEFMYDCTAHQELYKQFEDSFKENLKSHIEATAGGRGPIKKNQSEQLIKTFNQGAAQLLKTLKNGESRESSPQAKSSYKNVSEFNSFFEEETQELPEPKLLETQELYLLKDIDKNEKEEIKQQEAKMRGSEKLVQPIAESASRKSNQSSPDEKSRQQTSKRGTQSTAEEETKSPKDQLPSPRKSKLSYEIEPAKLKSKSSRELEPVQIKPNSSKELEPVQKKPERRLIPSISASSDEVKLVKKKNQLSLSKEANSFMETTSKIIIPKDISSPQTNRKASPKKSRQQTPKTERATTPVKGSKKSPRNDKLNSSFATEKKKIAKIDYSQPPKSARNYTPKSDRQVSPPVKGRPSPAKKAKKMNDTSLIISPSKMRDLSPIKEDVPGKGVNKSVKETDLHLESETKERHSEPGTARDGGSMSTKSQLSIFKDSGPFASIEKQIAKFRKAHTIEISQPNIVVNPPETPGKGPREYIDFFTHLKQAFGIYECVNNLTGHEDSVCKVIQLKDGRIATCSKDATIKVWSIHSGECIITFTGHTDPVWSLTQLEDGRLASGSEDKTIKIWNLATEECEFTLTGHREEVNCVIEMPDGRLLSSSIDKSIMIWDLQEKCWTESLGDEDCYVFGLTVLFDGRIASGHSDGAIRVWNAKEGLLESILEGHDDYVWCIRQLNDCRLVTGSADNSIKIWSLLSEKCLITLTGHTSVVYDIVELGDSSLLSCSGDKTIKIWNLGTMACDTTLTNNEYHVNSLAILKDGGFASASEDMSVNIWH